jgi:hypothetical protein
LGSNVYFTSSTENPSGQYLWSLPLGYTISDTSVVEFDSNAYGKSLSGIAFDGSSNVYLGVSNNKVIKLNSSFVYQSDVIIGLSNVKDVDLFGGELYICTSDGVKVYSTPGAFSRTFGPLNTTGLVIDGGSVPSTF